MPMHPKRVTQPTEPPQPAPSARRRVALDPEPRSAGLARTVVSELLEACGLEQLLDTAALLVSELVTNAVLHTATSIDLRCEVERRVLCVQVSDRSHVLPGMRRYETEALTGRGLGMVELLSTAWGVEAEELGKTVWFQLAGSPADHGALPPVRFAPHERWEGGQFAVHLLGLPVALVAAAVQQGDSALRDAALLSLAASSDEPPTWQSSHIDLGPIFDAARAARDDGQEHIDLLVHLPEGAGAAAVERLTLIDEADRLAMAGRLLTSPSRPEVAACRRWLLTQIGSQERGGAPVHWRMPDPLPPLVELPALPFEVRQVVDTWPAGLLFADDADLIVHANETGAALLGWEVDELVGQRLVSIVPPQFRQAHLAGLSRCLVSAESGAPDRTWRFPALRRDGSQTELDATLTLVRVGDGRTAFGAALRRTG
jgi:PAS domain S-box-containing protein